MFQVYFGVTTLIDATSIDSQKVDDEQKEVGNYINVCCTRWISDLELLGCLLGTHHRD